MQTSTSPKFQARERTREINASELSLPQSIRHSRNQIWENWGRTARCQPEFSFYPERVEDLIQIVEFGLDIESFRGYPRTHRGGL